MLGASVSDSLPLAPLPFYSMKRIETFGRKFVQGVRRVAVATAALTWLFTLAFLTTIVVVGFFILVAVGAAWMLAL